MDDLRAVRPANVDLSEQIAVWKDARFGRQVRAATVEALEKLQTQANAAMDFVAEKGDEIDTVRQDVDTVRQNAQDAVDHANDITDQYKAYADAQLEATRQERTKAEEAKSGADQAAVLSQSWAVGGTQTRDGENADNAKYWSSVSQSQAETARSEADRAAQYSAVIAPSFIFDPGEAALYMKSGVGVDFGMTDAILYWRIT